MHVFQPLPFDIIEINPFEKFGKEWAVLTTEADDRVNAMTISWGGVGVLWNKNVATVYVRESRYSHEILDAGEYFSISFFEAQYRRILQYLGAASGRQEDKFKGSGLNVNRFMGVPFVDESNFTILCKTLSQTILSPEDIRDKEILDTNYSNGDFHTMYVGEIIQLLAR